MHSTDFLVAKNSFLRGMARALDLGSTINKHSYNTSKTPEEADFRAISNDWNMVGRDIEKAYNELKEQEKICFN
jgi:hypothetical protein